jgi:protein-tyrosine phosphatase
MSAGIIINLRDIGGVPAADGQWVRGGLVYRSGHLGGGVATGAERRNGTSEVTSRRITTVFDLRTAQEVDSAPDMLPDEVRLLHLDVLAGATSSIAAHIGEVFADPGAAARVFADGLVDRHYEQTYRNLVTLDSARRGYAQLFQQLAGCNGPVLFHCTAGKDRTGWAAASLLTLLGVPPHLVMADYLASNSPVMEAFEPHLAEFARLGGDPELIRPAFLVSPAYLDAAFNAVHEHFGTIECYFEEGLGVGTDLQQGLRQRLLGSSSPERC